MLLLGSVNVEQALSLGNRAEGEQTACPFVRIDERFHCRLQIRNRKRFNTRGAGNPHPYLACRPPFHNPMHRTGGRATMA